jgi:hypothetical protein
VVCDAAGRQRWTGFGEGATVLEFGDSQCPTELKNSLFAFMNILEYTEMIKVTGVTNGKNS